MGAGVQESDGAIGKQCLPSLPLAKAPKRSIAMSVANRLAPDITFKSLAYPENSFGSISSIYRVPYTTSYPSQAAVSSRRINAA